MAGETEWVSWITEKQNVLPSKTTKVDITAALRLHFEAWLHSQASQYSHDEGNKNNDGL